MVTIKRYVFFAIVFHISSCGFLEKGYDDVNGQYVPKKPRFKLKDRAGNIFPDNLDTTNVYRLVESYYMGNQTYPNNYYSENRTYDEFHKVKNYMRFHSNGRCFGVSIPATDSSGNNNFLNEKDLNPNKPSSHKEYYYSKDGKTIRIESFVYGQGYGMYVILDYYLNTQGDTLVRTDKDSKTIYIKQKLPAEWKNTQLIGRNVHGF